MSGSTPAASTNKSFITNGNPRLSQGAKSVCSFPDCLDLRSGTPLQGIFTFTPWNGDRPQVLLQHNFFPLSASTCIEVNGDEMRTEIIALLGRGVLCAPAFGANPARPGTVNYIEGGVFLDGKQLHQKDVGSTELYAGHVLSTTAGNAEILLTPGVFFRLDDNSAVKMISPSITPTEVELERGRAAVEVDELYPQNNLEIQDAGVSTQLVKPGITSSTPTIPPQWCSRARLRSQWAAGNTRC
jgi:hypothetical protein